MTAKQASELSITYDKNVGNFVRNLHLESIIGYITVAAKSGYRHTYVSMSDETKESIVKLGYTVYNEGCEYRIEW